MSFTKPSVFFHVGRASGGARYTDKMEFLKPSVLIGFKARPAPAVYPTLAMKQAVGNAAIQAMNIIRIANDELARVVLARRPESPLFIAIMAAHFNLVPGNVGDIPLVDNVPNKPFSLGAVFQHDRRWFLEKIRRGMLSISFHLNTGVYLIDMDTAARTVQNGAVIPAGTGVVADGYIYARGDQSSIFCGYRNGEIHIDFNDFPNYSVNSCARVIIHEAAHKYWGIPDHVYAKDAGYPPPLSQSIENADSFAWAAVSLALGGVRMGYTGSNDWNQCP
jgi:hypothetical protein